MHFEKEESEVGAMTFYLKRKGLEIFSYQLPWSQRLPFILYWQILRRESLLTFFLLARSAESREKKAFFFSRLGASISASQRKFLNEKR